MHRGRRTIRLAKWAGVGQCALIAATWLVSHWWAFGLDAGPLFTVAVESGMLIMEGSAGRADGFYWFSRPAVPWPLLPKFDWINGYLAAFIPCWLLLALLALPTVLLFWLNRRKPRPGFCACGYDLTGNVSGVCPECGTAAEREGEKT